MAYSLTLLGVRESILDAIKTAMTAKIDDLNNVLLVAPEIVLPSLVDASWFHIGDVDSMPDATTSPFWVTIEAGGKQDGTDATIKLQSNQAINEWTYFTNIYWYLASDALPNASPFQQAEQRTRLRARFTDWLLFDVLNTKANLRLTLNSQQFSPGTPDLAGWCHVQQVTAGWVQKSFGGSNWVYMAHYQHFLQIVGPA